MTILPVGTPTTQLPAIGKIKQSSLADLRAALLYLGSLYNPEVRIDRHSYRRTDTPSCLAPSHDTRIARGRGTSDAAEVSRPHLDAIRADIFERSYAIRWLTTLVARADQLHTGEDDGLDAESVVGDAAGLLAICAGTASAGTRSRVFSFDLTERVLPNAADIKIQLTDLPLDNQDYTSLGAQTWGGACLMADLIVQSPSQFTIGAVPASRSLRVLELGAGTGLVGLAAGKVLEQQGTNAQVIMTDFHSAVLENLRNNASANFPGIGTDCSSVEMSVHHLDWSQVASSYSQQLEAPFDRAFDLILGADIIYELEHARWIKTCVEKLLRVPPVEGLSVDALVSSSPPLPNPEFHLVMPLRSTHAAESKTVEEVFPSASSVRGGAESPPEAGSVQRFLAITAREVMLCEDLARGGGNEVEYVHFTITWV